MSMGGRILFCLIPLLSLGCAEQQWEQKVMSSPSTATLSARELYEVFDANEFSANQRYRDKVITVSGVVREVRDNGDTVLVILEAGVIGSVFCSVSISHSSRLASLAQGDFVRLKGMCRGVVLGHTMVIGCVFVDKPDPSPTPSIGGY